MPASLRSLAMLAALTSLVFIVVVSQAEEKQPQRLRTQVFKRAKLTSSPRVLEGLVTRDATLIEQGAREMAEMSEASQWPRADDDRYEHYGAEFRRLCRRLSQQAKQQNYDGAGYIYSQLTASCISCHDHVRAALKVADDPNGPFQLIPTVPSESNRN